MKDQTNRNKRAARLARVAAVIAVALAWAAGIGWTAGEARAAPPDAAFIKVGERGGFVLGDSDRPFVPWGFNYDHDEKGRLIEDYWEAEWAKVREDFREMKDLGANVVRIHLQVGRFMKGPKQADQAALDRLARLLALAEETGLYLDLTGLGCYHKKDVPAWYDALDERQRWDVQAAFWQAVAGRCAKSPAVFCYDLMNEPVVPGGDKKRDDWLGPAFAGKHFVQFVSLDLAGRDRVEVARAWVDHLAAAVRRADRRHLVTVGLVPWSLDRPGLRSGFVPAKIAGPLDFVCVHIYPEKGKLDQDIETLKGFHVSKPVVVEEIFPLRCSAEELGQFMDQSKGLAAGWIGFYWGKTPDECRRSGQIGDALALGWLELFQKRRP